MTPSSSFSAVSGSTPSQKDPLAAATGGGLLMMPCSSLDAPAGALLTDDDEEEVETALTTEREMSARSLSLAPGSNVMATSETLTFTVTCET